MKLQVKDVGEYELISRLRDLITFDPSSPLPFNEDASAAKNEDVTTVINADMFVGSTDIPPGMSYYQIGKKVVTMSVSDLAAKGVKPRGFLLSVGLPRNFLVEDYEQIIRGVDTQIRKYGGWFLGGDTNEANDLILDGISFGYGTRLISRKGIQPNDIIAVTGEFGLTGAGLNLLLEKRTVEEDSIRLPLVSSVYEPEAAVEIGVLLARGKEVTAAIDSSDGLARSLHLLAQINGVGIQLQDIPIAQPVIEYAQLFGLNPIDLALYGGEEYHLVCACRADQWRELSIRVPSMRMIGRAIKSKDVMIRTPDHDIKVENHGWEHFVG